MEEQAICYLTFRPLYHLMDPGVLDDALILFLQLLNNPRVDLSRLEIKHVFDLIERFREILLLRQGFLNL